MRTPCVLALTVLVLLGCSDSDEQTTVAPVPADSEPAGEVDTEPAEAATDTGTDGGTDVDTDTEAAEQTTTTTMSTTTTTETPTSTTSSTSTTTTATTTAAPTTTVLTSNPDGPAYSDATSPTLAPEHHDHDTDPADNEFPTVEEQAQGKWAQVGTTEEAYGQTWLVDSYDPVDPNNLAGEWRKCRTNLDFPEMEPDCFNTR